MNGSLSDMNLSELFGGLSFTTIPIPPSAPFQIQCGECSKVLPKESNPQRCGRCRLVYYCSKECQITAWKIHKATCKKPEEVPMMYAQGIPTSLSDFKVGQVPQWDKKQIEAEQHTRDTTTLFKKLKNAKKQPPVDQKKLGFNKNKPSLDDLLKKGEYAEINKLLKLDSITPSERNWLRQAAELGHVPMMQRLTIILTSQITQQDRSKVEEAVRWYHLSVHCTELDLTCNSDHTARAVLDAVHLLGHTLKAKLTQQEQATYFAKEYILKIISSWTPKENHPSPEWAAASGMDVYFGVNSVKPQNEWYQLRLAKHKELTGAKEPEIVD